MSIAKRPQQKQEKPLEKEVEDFINKGGTPPQKDTVEKKTESLQLRIPSDLLKRVDRLVKNRDVKIPRHTWLVEAIIEKVKREESE